MEACALGHLNVVPEPVAATVSVSGALLRR